MALQPLPGTLFVYFDKRDKKTEKPRVFHVIVVQHYPFAFIPITEIDLHCISLSSEILIDKRK